MRTPLFIAVFVAALLLPRIAAAQDAAITGVVTDASGAVLPGVTVEANSGALTEKVRAVVTDNTGQYRIVALPPGTLRSPLCSPDSARSSGKAFS